MAVKSRITPWKKEEDEGKEEKLPKSYGRFSGWSEEEEEEDVIFVPQEEKVDSKKKEKKPGVFKQVSDWVKRTFTPGVTDTSTGEFHPAPKEGKDYTVRYTPGEYVKQQRIESVYSSRTPEGVKHSAEIEIAEIDQKLLNLEAQRMDFARYLTRKVKPIEKRTPEERKAEEELYQKMEQIKKDYMGDTKAAKYTSLEDFALKVLDPDIYDLKRSKEKLEMVIENQDTGASNNLVKVFKEAVPGLKDIENIPAGFGAMFGLLFQIEENVVSKKIENGEKLTPEEEVIQKRIIAKREYEKRDISDLQAGAQGVPGSLSMSIDFLLLGGAGAGLKGIPKYLALAQKATKVAFSTQLPRMFSQFADRVGDEYETKPTKDGGFELIKMKEGEVPTTAAILSIADVWSMAQAETLGGEILDDALGFVYKPLAKKFSQTAMSNTVKNSKAFQVIKNLYSSESLKEFVSRQSPLGELFEEFVQSQIEKLTHGQPLGLTGAEAKRITVSTLLLSLIMAPLGLADLPRGESKKITSKDLEKFPEGIRNEIESGLQGKETIDKDDLKVISENIVKKIETGEITIEGESEKETETLYSAQKGEIVEKEQAYKKVKEVDTDQVEILREFVKEGDAVAKELLYGKGDVERTKIDYAKTDYYIQKKLSGEYEAIKYNNANMPIKGVEYHDLKENRFYATSEDAAKLYKNQTRGEKYNTPEFKEFAKKVDESLAPPVVKKEKVIKPKEAETKKSNLGWVEIKNAKSLEISGFKVYSHKGEDGGYIITEATSGLAMATGKTLKEAKEKAQAAVDRYGVKVVKERIAAQVKELGSRPDEKPYMRIRTQEDVERGRKETRKKLKKEQEKENKEASKRTYEEVVKDLQKYLKKRGISVSKNNNATIWEARQELRGQLDTLLNQIRETPNQERKEMFSKQYDKLSLLEREALMLEKRFPEKFKPKTQVEDAAKYEELKKKMKKRLTPEEAAEAQRLIDEEVKGIPGASVEMADSEASQFFGKLKELRNSTSLETKIEAAEEAIKEFSPALARDHEFTPEEVQARTKRIQSMSAIDLTDIVSLVNNLSEKELLTIVKKFRSPGVRGMFRPARGGAVSIDILASLFYDPAIAAKTVAHEIGHFVDFLPDNRMAGTFASKIAGVKSKAKNFGEFKDAVMREEIYTLSKDVWRPYDEGTATEGYIQYRKSGEELYADFISMVFMDPNLLKKEAPVTIEAWIAFLDNKPDAKAEFEEAWDLMLESGDALYDKRLKSIREMFKTGDKILWGAGETEELSKRNKLSYKLMDAWQNVKLLGSQTKRMVVDVKTPLIEIEAKAQKRLGRKLTTEEKISKQVESLQKIQAQEQTYVDTYYDPIYQRLKAEGLEWEDLGTYQFLNRIVKERGDITPQEALESLEGISVMDLFSEQDKKNPLISRVLTNLERKETDTLLTDLIEDSVKSGESISVVIEKLRKGVFETLFGTIEPKTKSGAYFAQKLRSGMLAERLSLYLPMKAGIANPLGFTTQTSLDQLAHMEKKLGTKKYNLLKDIAEKDFRAGSLALLKLKSAQHYFGARKIEKIIQNEAYVTFAVNHYLSKYIPAQIRQQSGTLKGVANVADATILKNTSMLRAMEHNEMRRNAINFILTNDPTQIQAAPTKFDSSLGVRVLDLVKANKMKDWSVLYYMENGNLRQVMVTNEVYNAINERILENNFVGIKVLELLNNKYYRPLFVGYNLAFNVYNVQRDFLRFWKNSSWLTFPEAIYYYAKAVPSVAKSVFNKQDSEVIKEMKEKRMLGFYRNDVYDNPESEVSNGVFKLYETEAGQEKAKGVKEKTQKLLETISNISQTIEMIPKVAGKMSIDKKQVFKTDAEARDMIINYLGSPNFQNKGELYKYYNNIFLFSNAVKEGWRGDINVLAGNTPTGRKGSFVAMLRMVETTAVPVMLSFLIRHGLPPFDDDDRWGDLRELLEKIPKRDFVSFIPIPVGELGGKTVYIPVARAETDQLLAQIIWSLMDGLTDQPGGSLGEEIIDAFASEFPSINPLFTAAGAIITTASGGNPYDSFRGRNVFSPFTFDYMSGQEKAEILVEYLAGVSGLNVFIRTYDPRTYGEDSSPLQKAHQLPIIGNVIYRLLRESNYGIVETEWDTQREQNIQSRQEKQSTKKMMNEDAKQFISQGASSKEVEAKIKEYQELAVGFKEPKKGYSGSDLTTANNVRKMFKEELLKESGVLPSWRILDMTKNSQKEAELARQQERMSQTEFINYLRNLRMAEAISDTFVESLYKNGYISKDNYKKVVSGDRKKIYIYQ